MWTRWKSVQSWLSTSLLHRRRKLKQIRCYVLRLISLVHWAHILTDNTAEVFLLALSFTSRVSLSSRTCRWLLRCFPSRLHRWLDSILSLFTRLLLQAHTPTAIRNASCGDLLQIKRRWKSRLTGGLLRLLLCCCLPVDFLARFIIRDFLAEAVVCPAVEQCQTLLHKLGTPRSGGELVIRATPMTA